jgi:hypothetical protein
MAPLYFATFLRLKISIMELSSINSRYFGSSDTYNKSTNNFNQKINTTSNDSPMLLEDADWESDEIQNNENHFLSKLASVNDLKELAEVMQEESRNCCSPYVPSKELIRELKFCFEFALKHSQYEQLNNNWPINCSRILYSLKQFLPGGVEFDEFILTIVDSINNQNKLPFDQQALCTSFYGLQHLTISPGVRALLNCLTMELKEAIRVKSVFTPQQLSLALFGLRNLEDCPEVSDAIEALLEHTEKNGLGERKCFDFYPIDFRPIDICMAYEGLRNLSGNVHARKLFEALLHYLERVKLTPSNVGKLLDSVELFGENAIPVIKELTYQVKWMRDVFSPSDMASAFYQLQNFRDGVELRKLVNELLRHFNWIEEKFTPKEMKNIFFVLKVLGDCQESRDLLRFATYHLKKIQDKFTPNQISNLLYRLKDFSDCDEVRDVLNALYPHLKKVSSTFDATQICRSFFGLRNMPNCSETRQILRALLPHFEAVKFQFSPANINEILVGLQEIKEGNEVNAVVNKLADYIEDITCEFSASEISEIIYHLRKLSDSPELRRVFLALAPHLRAVSSTFKPMEMSKSFVGLRDFPNCFEVRCLIKELIIHFEVLPPLLSPEEIVSIFKGIRNLVKGSEIRILLAILRKHLDKLTCDIDPSVIEDIFYSLRNIEDSVELRAVFGSLAFLIKNNVKAEFEPKQMSKAFSGLNKISDCREIGEVLAALLPHLAKIKRQFTLEGIVQICYSLQYLKNRDEVREVLTVIALHCAKMEGNFYIEEVRQLLYGLRNFIFTSEAKAILNKLASFMKSANLIQGHHQQTVSDSIHLAEVIYSLFTLLQENSKEAIQFIVALMNKLDLPIDKNKLANNKGTHAFVLSLLHEHVQKEQGNITIDLHGLSHELTEWYVNSTLDELLSKTTSVTHVKIIYGRGSHRHDNKNVMRSIVQGVFSERFSLLESQWETVWYSGYMIVYQKLSLYPMPLTLDDVINEHSIIEIEKPSKLKKKGITPTNRDLNTPLKRKEHAYDETKESHKKIRLGDK